MFKLRKLNVIKIVSSETKKNKLIGKGFVEVQGPISIEKTSQKDTANSVDYNSMEYQDLRTLAAKNDINTHRMKKKEIVEALEKAGK